jgi:DEAD/DEAH box helicase domain-containing protein
MSELLCDPVPARYGPDAGGHRAVRGTIAAVVDQLGRDPRLVHIERLPARPGRGALPHRSVPAPLTGWLPDGPLWAHQVAALDLVRDGHDVVVATGTSSGKSLCYQLPAAEAALEGATALLVYPTKALAQDQLASITARRSPGLVAAAYDGDCGPDERAWVRQHANVLLTNPDMLHQGILANHRRWAPFLARLRLVAVDELHVLRGVFGSHAAQVLRRLRRLARHYGADPTFVFTSATIGDPAGLASDLCGRTVHAVTNDASPLGERAVLVWNPEAAGTTSTDRNRGDDASWSVNAETAAVAARLVDAGLRTLVFCPSRRGVELVAGDLRRLVDPASRPAIRSYRGGYLAEERREIERDLFGGRLRAVVATNALELGVDVGGLDAVVLCGYPGTIASFRQQIGRSGRSGRPSLAVLVAGRDQLDQWVARHPQELFRRPPERAVVNLDNPYVYVPHLGCAAHELPLRHEDAEFWPTQLDDGVRRLVLDDRAAVRCRSGRRVAAWTGRGSPAAAVGLRSTGGGEFRIRELGGTDIGTVDEARVDRVAHPGAVYLHQGRAWQVLEVDRVARTCWVEPHDEDTYTQTRSESSIALFDQHAATQVGRCGLGLGSVEVTGRVTGYEVRRTADHQVLDRVELDLAPTRLWTTAVWYRFGDEVLEDAGVTPAELPGALHALEHAAIGILPLFAICDRWDVGGVSTPFLAEVASAAVVIHDAHPGGAGIAELAYGAADRHLAATLEVLDSCPCRDGCPACVQSPKCGNGNEPLDKAAAAQLLRATLAASTRT